MATIFELIDAGDAVGIRELTAREPDAAAAKDEQGLSAIMRASYRGGEVFDAVRVALAEDQTIANASWDWGEGDWETGLGAAAHMGRRDIAELLLAHGARMDIFAAAMLDEVDVVRALLPLQGNARGPLKILGDG